MHDAGLHGYVRYGDALHGAHEPDVPQDVRHVRGDVHELRDDVRKDGERQRDDDALRRNVQALRGLLHDDVQDVDGSLGPLGETGLAIPALLRAAIAVD